MTEQQYEYISDKLDSMDGFADTMLCASREVHQDTKNDVLKLVVSLDEARNLVKNTLSSVESIDEWHRTEEIIDRTDRVREKWERLAESLVVA